VIRCRMSIASAVVTLLASLCAAQSWAAQGVVGNLDPCLSRQSFNAFPPPGSSCGRLYSPESPFNRRVPPHPRLLLRTSDIVSRITELGPPPRIDGGVAGTRDDWGHPIYLSLRSDPVFTVHCTQSSVWGRCSLEGKRIHIPNAAQPSRSEDRHLAVIDQVSGWEYDFWQVRQKPSGGGTLTVSWGGRTRIDGDGLGSAATASGFGLAAGIIGPSELAAGEIDHALFMIVRCTNGSSVWPAGSNPGRSCSSIGLSNSGAPAMGQHFFLAMSAAQIEALPDPSWQKTILRAMGRYGLYVGDTGGNGWGIGVESGASDTSFGLPEPWALLGRRFQVPSDPGPAGAGRYYRFSLRDAVDWPAKLRVLAVCVARRGCGS
jgi:hypothetical protein